MKLEKGSIFLICLAFLTKPNKNIISSEPKAVAQKNSNEKHRLLYIGAIVPWKGVHNLINALDYIDSAYRKNIEVILAGNISGTYKGMSYKEYIFSLIRKNKGIIRYVGYIEPNKLPKLYQQIDLHVHPVYYMTASTSLLETMACGIPAIVTKVGGAVDYVDHNKTGLLIEQDIKALSNAISYLIDDEQLRRKLGRRAQKKSFKEFDWGVIAPKIINIYEGLQ